MRYPLTISVILIKKEGRGTASSLETCKGDAVAPQEVTFNIFLTLDAYIEI